MRSNTWADRANIAIHNGALTNSKRPACFVNGIYPSHLVKANGCYVWDYEGNRYIDFICSLGANLLGHQNIKIKQAIINQLDKGLLYSLGSTAEVEAAEILRVMFYFMGKVRFLKTGSEASIASLRIARSHTKRSIVLSEGYHAWHDEFVSLTPPATGCVEHKFIEKLTSLNQINENVAAVIVEPVITDFSSSRMQFLIELRERCTKYGVMLIFDEIITGFRYRKNAVCLDTGIRPDILLLGKALGGGLPLSAVLTAPGIGEDQDWFVSSTFAGDLSALVAFRALGEQIATTHKNETLWAEGERFQSEFNALSDLVKLEGYPTRGVLSGSDLNKALFMQESCKAGILFGPSWFFAHPHIELREIVINSCRDILQRIKHGHVKLEGEMPVKPFAQKQRE